LVISGLLFFVLMPNDISGVSPFNKLQLRVEVQGLAVLLVDVEQVFRVVLLDPIDLVVSQIPVEDSELVSVEPDQNDGLRVIELEKWAVLGHPLHFVLPLFEQHLGN